MVQTRRRLKKSVSDFIFKTLIVALITVILMIVMKSNVNFKTNFYKYVYDTSFSFNKFTNLYNKYFKDLKTEDNNNTKTVATNKLDYTKVEKYQDGAKLYVSNDYSVPAQESGIVVFIGKKDNYDNVIIVQQINGIDMWYGNVENTNYQLYDYVKKGEILGVSNKYLYVLYKQNGKVLNYEEYL